MASANPARDDDFYTGGLYPGGFNGLAQLLIVPSDEPAVAWEHSLTVGDRANRLHFRLTEAQVSAGSWLRFDMDLALGGSLMGGQMQPGFAEHDVVIRFRNGAGVATEIYSERVTAAGVVRVEFPVSGVQATAGANTLEVVRTGPALPGISYWLTFDYLRLEADAGGNEAPVIAGVGVQTVDELKTLTVNLQGTDGDKPPTPLTYGLVSGPEGLTVSAAGVVSWTPTEGQGPSVNAVVVRVTDNGVPPMSATNEFEVVVREVNRAPVIGAVAGQAVEEQKAWTLALGVADEDLPPNQFSYGLVSGPEGLEVSAGGVVSWTPTEGQGPSVNTVVVRVTDNGVPPLSGTNQFTVMVLDVNTPPVLPEMPVIVANEFDPIAFNLAGVDGDLPANRVRYTLLTGPAGLTVSSAGAVAWSPTERQAPSTNVIQVRLTDDGVPPMGATGQFVIVVREVNASPIMALITSQVLAEETALALALSAQDADFPVNSFRFGLVEGPAGLTVTESGAVTWIPTEAQGPSTNRVLVRVTDSGFPPLSSTNEFLVSVQEVNSPPQTTGIADDSVDEGTAWSLQVVATDRDLPRNRISISLVGGPEGMTLSGDGLLRWTPTETDGPSVKSVTVRVTDDGLPALSVTNRFNLTVREVNRPPIMEGLADQSLDELATWSVALSVGDPDRPVNAHEFTLISGPKGVTLSPEGLLEWTPGEAQGPSTNTVIARVTDSGVPALSATNRFVLVVREVNSPPVLESVEPQDVEELTDWAFALTASDSDLPFNSHTFHLVSGPAGMTLSPEGLLEWRPREEQGPSTVQVVVRVVDSGTPPQSGTNQFTMKVTEANAAPVLTAIPDRVAGLGESIVIPLTASDSDIPVLQAPIFDLVSGEPGAVVDSAAAEFRWVANGSGEHTFSIRVTDQGSPRKSDQKSFVVRVASPRLDIRAQRDQIFIAFDSRVGWTYELLGLEFSQVGDDSPRWQPLTDRPLAGTGRRIVVALPAGSLNTGGLVRFQATSSEVPAAP